MENAISLLQKANKSYETADHLAYVTYPLIKEPKLIITIIEHLYISLSLAINSLIYYEKLYKRISIYEKDNLHLFKTKCIPRYNIDRKYILLLQDLKDILEQKQQSPMEFIRKEKIVICSNDYKLKTVSMPKVKEYISDAKPLLNKINSIIAKNDTRLR